MRYFKYDNVDDTFNNALKEQYKTLTQDEKRTFRKLKRFRRFASTVMLLVCVGLVTLSVLLLRAIPEPDSWFFGILAIVGEVVGGFILLIVSCFLAAVITNPLWKKVESLHIPTMSKEIFSRACLHLRDYYGLKEPYVVTKCFDATDKNFKNHDVCIFVVGDELRLTADLVSGFLHGKRDLGCYAFKREDITLLKQRDGKHLSAELRVDNAVFILGYRAKGFIESFIAKTDS